MMCIRPPCPGDAIPDFPKDESDFDIKTTAFPSISPWAFLAGAIGNIVGSVVGGGREAQQVNEQPMSPQMPDLFEVMQREETNRLIRELLNKSKEKKNTFTLEPGTGRFGNF